MTVYEILELIVLPMATMVVGVVTALVASNGFWNHRADKLQRSTSEARLLMGIAHTRLMTLCKTYIDRGWITPDEYEDLYEYLYKPYIDMGGNGAIKKMMEQEINHLPVRPERKLKDG